MEIVVNPKTGKWYTVGDYGAEFIDIPTGAIVFNHLQSKSLLENGYVSGRASALVSGTAMLTGGAKFPNISSSSTSSSGSSSSNSGSGSSGSSKPSSGSNDSNNSDDDLDKIDWIEIAIKRIESAIDRLKNVAESAFKTLANRAKASASEMSKITEEIELQQRGYERYLQEANSVGLSDELAEKVRNGTIDINEYNSETRDLISQYQNWYDKAVDCSDAVADLHKNLAELYQDNFEDIETDFENQLSLIKHLSNTYETSMSKIEERGRFASVQYYTALNAVESKNLSVLNSELEALTKSFSEAMESGEIEVQSEAWYSFQQSINDVKESIDETTLSILKNEKAMRELEWSYFDYAQERIAQITQESDFLIDLMSNSNLYKDSGQFNEKGESTLGLRTQNYNVYMAQADKYAQQMLRIEKSIADDPYNKDLIERREELLKLQQDSIIAAENEKKAIVDLVKNGIEIELKALKELITSYTDSLDNAKDLFEYQKNVEEQASNIASLQKQLSAYEGDTSEETRTRVQKLQVELTEAKDKLAETEYDRFISENKKTLDELYNEYEELLNERLDDVDALMADMIDSVNSNASLINQTLEKESEKVGYVTTDGMQKIWSNDGSASSIVSQYGDKFTSQLTSVNQVLNAIQTTISNMVFNSDVSAISSVSNTSTTTTPITPPKVVTQPETTATETPVQEATKQISVGGTINAGSAKIYTAPNGKALNQYFKSDPIYTVLDEKDGFLKVRWHKAPSGESGWFKKSDVKAYRTGGLVDYTGLAQLDGTRQNPELVLNSTDTKNFIGLRDVLRNMANNSLSIKSDNYSGFNTSVLSGILDISNMASRISSDGKSFGNSIESININIPIDHVENYNDFVNQLKQDNQFEELIQSMTIDRLVGGSSLAKSKYVWK